MLLQKLWGFLNKDRGPFVFFQQTVLYAMSHFVNLQYLVEQLHTRSNSLNESFLKYCFALQMFDCLSIHAIGVL